MHRVAHRGYSWVAPENTLPALAGALRAGATHVEFDVRTTADDVPVVIHDRTVDRTTDGSGYVWDLSFASLRALDAGSWFSPAFAGVRVPSLAEVLALPLGDASLLLEIKPPASPVEVKRIVAMLGDLAPRTIIQSFDPAVLALVRDAAPDIRRGLLRLRFDEETPRLARELDVVCCNPPAVDILDNPGIISSLSGIEVMPWTANDLGAWPALAAAGVAGLITDRAGELTGWASSS
jgi:glycerophosphoryl diester phosphodiesterase